MRLLSERVQRLVEGYREVGHLHADLDPLGLVQRGSPEIALENYGLADEDLDLVFSSENVSGPKRKTLRDLVSLLRETYCRTIGVQMSHLNDVELRSWLQTRMETTRNRLPMLRADRIRVFQQVIGAEVFEQFLQNKFLGSKRFSLEGAESLIPLARAAGRAGGPLQRHRDRDRDGAPRAAQRAGQRAQEAGRRRSSPSSRTSSTPAPTSTTAAAT